MPSYTLNPRQRAFYTNRTDQWRETATTDTDTGDVEQSDPARVGVSIYGHYTYTQNDSLPNGVARMKEKTALTEDEWECHVAEDLQDGDYLVDVTGDTNNLAVHRVQGEPNRNPAQGRRNMDYQNVKLMSVAPNVVPQAIRDFYA